MDAEEMLQSVGQWFLDSGLRIALILLMMTIAMKAIDIIARRIFDMINRNKVVDDEIQKRTDTLRSIIRYSLNIIVFAVAAMMVLSELGIEVGPILAAAGVAGLAVGFGAQKLVEDVISGFFILLEDQIRVGDVVAIAGQSGLVERVTLRMVILRDLAGNVHYVRNGQIDIVTNMTKEYSRYVFDIGVAYRENVDEVIEVIKAVDEDLRRDEKFASDILDPIEILGLDKFGDSALIIKARTRTKPIKQWGVAREFNRRLKMAFDEKGIEIPFPHRTLYWGEPKSGAAPAVNVHIKNEKVSA